MTNDTHNHIYDCIRDDWFSQFNLPTHNDITIEYDDDDDNVNYISSLFIEDGVDLFDTLLFNYKLHTIFQKNNKKYITKKLI